MGEVTEVLVNISGGDSLKNIIGVDTILNIPLTQGKPLVRLFNELGIVAVPLSNELADSLSERDGNPDATHLKEYGMYLYVPAKYDDADGDGVDEEVSSAMGFVASLSYSGGSVYLDELVTADYNGRTYELLKIEAIPNPLSMWG